MRWPWRPPLKLQRAVIDTARAAAELAGLPPPAPPRGGARPLRHRDLGALLARTGAALSAIAERLHNQQRSIADLRASLADARAKAEAASTRAPRRAAIALADLADRVRTPGQDAVPDWLPQQLAAALHQLDAAEFTDSGAADATRHEIVGRRRAGPGHPAGSIARTVRPGVLLAGRVLRPQQVIVYADIAENDHE